MAVQFAGLVPNGGLRTRRGVLQIWRAQDRGAKTGPGPWQELLGPVPMSMFRQKEGEAALRLKLAIIYKPIFCIRVHIPCVFHERMRTDTNVARGHARCFSPVIGHNKCLK